MIQAVVTFSFVKVFLFSNTILLSILSILTYFIDITNVLSLFSFFFKFINIS